MHILRQAWHQFRAHPGFNAFIILLLALGIGANTTMFSLVNAVLLRPLPYPQPGELALVRKQPGANTAAQPGRGELVTDKEYLAWLRAGIPAFQAFAAYTNGTGDWRRQTGTDRVSLAGVTDGFFPLLGVRAHRGRLFSAEDTKPGAAPVGVLSYDFWQSRLGGADEVIGTQLTVDGEALTVVGVLPPGFEFTDPAQIWRALQLHEAAAPAADGRRQLSITLVRAIARLQPGADLAAAQGQLDQVSARLWENLSGPGPQTPAPAGRAPGGAAPAGAPASQAGPRLMLGFGSGPALLVPLQEHLTGALRPTLWLLFGSVGLVLLIACVNLANLQLMRATVRRHELAIRTALGASRSQLALGLLAESLLPAVLGGALGILLSCWGIHTARSLLAAQLPRVAPVAVDLPVVLFTLGLTLLTGLVFGLAPAWQVRRLAPQEALHAGGRTGLGSPGRLRWRQACVALEVALALALVADAGLLLQSFLRLRAVDLGFRTDALSLTLPTDESLRRGQGRPDPAAQARIAARVRELSDRYREALAEVPGVRQVALADRAPFSEFAVMFMTSVEGYTPSSTAPEPPMSAATVTADYFAVLGLRLVEGRFLTAADGAGAPLVAVVNEAFVRRFFPGQSVVGRRLASPAQSGQWVSIVGVVGDTRRNGFDRDPVAQVFFPQAQWTQPRLAALISFDGDPVSVGAAVLERLRRLRPDQAFDTPLTLMERLDRQLAPRRLVMNLLLGFAGIAVLLAATGIFGVMAYTVARRTHEFGVRMALGADRGRILRHVLAGAGAAVGVGVAGGLALAAASSRLLEASLFGVTRHDPLTLGLAAAGLALTGLVASLVPAWRASRVDPAVALRSD